MTDVELRDELMTLLTAGHETTATALSWAVERLTRTPEAMERLEADLDDDAYLDAVVRETLRLRPVITDIGRMLTRDHDVAGYRLPAGTMVLAAIGAMHVRGRPLGRPPRLQARALLRGRRRRRLHVGAFRRRRPPLPRRRLRPDGDADHPARGVPPGAAACALTGGRACPAAPRHDRARARRARGGRSAGGAHDHHELGPARRLGGLGVDPPSPTRCPPPRTGRARPRVARARRAPLSARRGRGRWSRCRSGSPWPSAAWPPWPRHPPRARRSAPRRAPSWPPGRAWPAASAWASARASGGFGRGVDALTGFDRSSPSSANGSYFSGERRIAASTDTASTTATTAAIGQARLVPTGTGRSARGVGIRLGLGLGLWLAQRRQPVAPQRPRRGRAGGHRLGQRVGLAPPVEARAQLALGLHAPEQPDQRGLGQAGLAGQPRGQLALLQPRVVAHLPQR